MILLENYGFTSELEQQLTQEERDLALMIARVTSIQKETYSLISEQGTTTAKLKSSIFYQDSDYVTYPAVGDFVVIKPNPLGQDIIYRVLERFSKFSRTNPSMRIAISKASEQMVATNFHYVFIMCSLNQDFNIKRLQRYVTTANVSGGTPVIILTKADLCEDITPYIQLLEKHFPFLEHHVVSSHTGNGIDSLEKYLSPGKTIVFLGSSGIGKSSLVNFLLGQEEMDVNHIREDDSKGRHTTTHRQMLFLENGAILIDTPGMRELSLLDVEDGLSDTFVDVEALVTTCRFHDCTHKKEPGCAILEGIEHGIITYDDYESYVKLQKEIRRSYVKMKRLENRVQKEHDTPRTKRYIAEDYE